jgi:hypothetical protein
MYKQPSFKLDSSSPKVNDEFGESMCSHGIPISVRFHIDIISIVFQNLVHA